MLFCLIGFFAVVAGVNAIMIRAAVSTFSGVETASARRAALRKRFDFILGGSSWRRGIRAASRSRLRVFR